MDEFRDLKSGKLKLLLELMIQDVTEHPGTYVSLFESKTMQDYFSNAKTLLMSRRVPEAMTFDWSFAIAVAHSVVEEMPYPRIDIVTSDAAKLVNTAKLSLNPSKWDDCVEPVVLKGNPYLFDDVLEIGFCPDTSGLFRSEKHNEEQCYLLMVEYGGSGFSRFLSIPIPSSLLSKIMDAPDANDLIMEQKRVAQPSIEFVVKYCLLMKAEKRPIEVVSGVSRMGRVNKQTNGKYCYQTISLTKKYIQTNKKSSQSDAKEFDTEGKHKTTVSVSGFLRQQHYGKGNSKVKTIWIDDFDRGQWVNDGVKIRKIVP